MRHNIGHLGRTQSPCRECSDRHAECHATCEKYDKFRQIHADEVAEIHQNKKKHNLGYGAKFRTEKEFHMIELRDNTFRRMRREKKRKEQEQWEKEEQ